MSDSVVAAALDSGSNPRRPGSIARICMKGLWWALKHPMNAVLWVFKFTPLSGHYLWVYWLFKMWTEDRSTVTIFSTMVSADALIIMLATVSILLDFARLSLVRVEHLKIIMFSQMVTGIVYLVMALLATMGSFEMYNTYIFWALTALNMLAMAIMQLAGYRMVQRSTDIVDGR